MVCVCIHTCVYESTRKAFSHLLGKRETTNQTSVIPFKCFIQLKPVENAVLINADSLFFAARNLLVPSERLEQCFIFERETEDITWTMGVSVDVKNILTKILSLVEVTLKNLEQSKGLHKKDRILNILHVY